MLNFAIMLLAIDCGNTQTKAALISNQGDLLWRYVLDAEEGLEDILAVCPSTPEVILGAASGAQPHWEGVQWLDAEASWPFDVMYEDSIGLDRLLAVAGASISHPGKDLLVVTMGTCITFNALHQNQFLGGIIAPGLMMRIQSMSHYTEHLPDLSSKVAHAMEHWEDCTQTQTTQESMLRGAIAGIHDQLKGEIEAWKARLNDPQIIFTGGDGTAFANHLKSGIFAASDLELKGLWAHWNYASNSTTT